jgi:hypothetical protein
MKSRRPTYPHFRVPSSLDTTRHPWLSLALLLVGILNLLMMARNSGSPQTNFTELYSSYCKLALARQITKIGEPDVRQPRPPASSPTRLSDTT